jgi:hypothetical protein
MLSSSVTAPRHLSCSCRRRRDESTLLHSHEVSSRVTDMRSNVRYFPLRTLLKKRSTVRARLPSMEGDHNFQAP